MSPAIALLEFASVAHGIVAADAMVKAAPVDSVHAGTVHPGKFLVLVAGDTASVEVAKDRGEEVVTHLATVFLPDIHPAVTDAIRGHRSDASGEALAVVETTDVAHVIAATDAAVKGTAISVVLLALADGLGGKGYALLTGPVSEVEAACSIASDRVPGDHLVGAEVVAQLHEEVAQRLWPTTGFLEQLPAGSVGD